MNRQELADKGQAIIDTLEDALWISRVPGWAGFTAAGYGDEYEKVVQAASAAVVFPGVISQVRNLPLLLRGGMTASQAGYFYGPTLLGVPSFGGIGLGLLYQQLQSRGGRDAKQALPPVAPGRRPRPIKPSRRVSPGQTSKPFWSNGKPKCKKGFRYDFKRKLCVKIK